MYFRLGNPSRRGEFAESRFCADGRRDGSGRGVPMALRARRRRGFSGAAGHGDDDYNPYIQKLCHLNSVATLDSSEPEAAARTRLSREAIATGQRAVHFRRRPGQLHQLLDGDAGAGGVERRHWARRADRRHQRRAGGAGRVGVLGAGRQAGRCRIWTARRRWRIRSGRVSRWCMRFLEIPILKGIITDTHFAKRNRMGRLLVFLARLNEPDGKPRSVIGHGSVYFLAPSDFADVLQPGKPAYLSQDRSAEGRTWPHLRLEGMARPGDKLHADG